MQQNSLWDTSYTAECGDCPTDPAVVSNLFKVKWGNTREAEKVKEKKREERKKQPLEMVFYSKVKK